MVFYLGKLMKLYRVQKVSGIFIVQVEIIIYILLN